MLLGYCRLRERASSGCNPQINWLSIIDSSYLSRCPKSLKLGRKPLPLGDGHQLALHFLGMDIRSKLSQQQTAQLSPISGRIFVPSFVSDVPFMCRFAQKGHRIRDLLGVTTPHEGKVMTHQRCPSMDIFGTAPKEAQRLFGPPMHCGEWLRQRQGV